MTGMCYGLVTVFEFWEYEVTCFHRRTHSGGLFVECFKMFQRMKQESSGYPSWLMVRLTKTNTSSSIDAQRGLLRTKH